MHTPDSHISIDFWNTLIDGATGGDIRQKIRYEALEELAQKHNRHITLEELKEARHKVSKEFDKVWLGQQRTHTPYELVVMLLRHLNLRLDEAELEYLIEVTENSFLQGAPKLAPGIEDAIPKLAESYSLSIISDTMFTPGHVLREYLRHKELFDYFQTFVFSNETGYSKPNPNAFMQVLDASGAKPEQSYHIGDLQLTDIKGAQSVGMNAILYTGLTEGQEKETTADYICSDWAEIVDLLVTKP